MRLRYKACVATALVVGLASLAEATPIPLTNGDFEAGTLVGWTTFLTVDGTIGTPAVIPFDVNGDNLVSNAARFQVGLTPPHFGDAGGGIYQSFVSSAGPVSFSADIASFSELGNDSGGRFRLLVDGAALAFLDFGPISRGATERATLGGVLNLSAGTHELRFLMTRPYTIGTGDTPYQLIDDVRIDQGEASVPEPATLILLGTGLAAMGASRRRR